MTKRAEKTESRTEAMAEADALFLRELVKERGAEALGKELGVGENTVRRAALGEQIVHATARALKLQVTSLRAAKWCVL